MDEQEKLNALLDLAESVGLGVRCVPVSPDGGDASAGALVSLRGRQVLFMNTGSPIREQIALLASTLGARPEIEEMYLPPVLRELLEELP